MNGSKINRKSKNCHDRFSHIPISSSSNKTTAIHGGRQPFPGTLCDCHLFQRNNQHLSSMKETRVFQTHRHPLQCSIFPIGNSQQPALPSLRHLVTGLSLNRLGSVSEHFMNNSKHNYSRNDGLSKNDVDYSSSVVQFRNKIISIQRGSHSNPIRPLGSAPSIFIPRPSSGILNNRSSKDIMISKENTRLHNMHLLHNRQTGAHSCLNNIELSPCLPSDNSTSDRIRKLHDSFHSFNFKCNRESPKYRCTVQGDHSKLMKDQNFTQYRTSNNVRTNQVARHSPLKSSEENRICGILREAFNEGNIFGGMGCSDNCSGDNEIILKPFLRRVEYEMNNHQSENELMSELTKTKKRDDDPLSEMSWMTISSNKTDISNRNEACDEKNSDLLPIVTNDNENNNNLLPDVVENSSDDESLELSDDGIQDLLMPMVLNFLSGQ